MIGLSIFIVIAVCIISLGILVFSIFGLVKLFKKAGYNGWEAFVPFYNFFILTKIAKLSIVWFIILIICLLLMIVVNGVFLSCVEIILLFINANFCYNLSKLTNKSLAWTLVSLVFGIITIPLLGIVASTSFSDTGVSKWGLFGSPEDKVKATSNNATNISQDNNLFDMPKINYTPKSTSVLSEGFVPIIDNKSIKNNTNTNDSSTNNIDTNNDLQEFKNKLFNDENDSSDNNNDSSKGNYYY